MKSLLKTTLFAISGAALFAIPAAAVTTTNGDLLLAFYQTNAAGDTVQPNTYVLNLGQISIWRENTQAFVSVSTVNPGIASSNIGPELLAAFGPDWATDGRVKWGIVGGLDQTTVGLVGGERQQSSYISRAASSADSGPTSTQPLITGGPRNFLRNNIEAFRVGSNGTGSDIGNDSGALITIDTNLATFEDFLPPVNGTGQFGVGQDILGTFGVGTLGGTVEGALDIWRMVGGSSTADLNSSGTDLTSGFGSGDAVLGQGQYVGTITIDSLGNLAVVPEPSSTLLFGILGTIGLSFRKRSVSSLS